MCGNICKPRTEVIHSIIAVAKFWRTEVEEFVIHIEYSDFKKKKVNQQLQSRISHDILLPV